MEENIENNIPEDKSVLAIFKTGKDRYGDDLMEMSNFLGVCTENVLQDIEKVTGEGISWEDCPVTDDMIASIATAVKTGFDLSKSGMLVADYSHLKPETIKGLKDGSLHIGVTKEGDANRPVVVNNKNTIVQQLTLKQIDDPTAILGDISALAMQMMLQDMLKQINRIGKDLSELKASIRENLIYGPFLNARDRIVRASNESGSEEEKFLEEADSYLSEGLTSLYLELNTKIKDLAHQSGIKASIKAVDNTLAYINEDFLLISNYTGLRAYLFCYRHRYNDAVEVLNTYVQKLESLDKEKLKGWKCSALDLIHEYYPYSKENRDYWVKQPKQIVKAINTFELYLDNGNKDFKLLEGEENNERKKG